MIEESGGEQGKDECGGGGAPSIVVFGWEVPARRLPGDPMAVELRIRESDTMQAT
jgi:hypothetical protein